MKKNVSTQHINKPPIDSDYAATPSSVEPNNNNNNNDKNKRISVERVADDTFTKTTHHKSTYTGNELGVRAHSGMTDLVPLDSDLEEAQSVDHHIINNPQFWFEFESGSIPD